MDLLFFEAHTFQSLLLVFQFAVIYFQLQTVQQNSFQECFSQPSPDTFLPPPPLVPKTLSLEAPARIKNKAPPLDWPQEGEVIFENAEMRYRENLPLVLKKVSFTIKPKEKIGIVGRTGSGKDVISQTPSGC